MNDAKIDLIGIPGETLVVGDHNSLLLFGSTAQNELGECSRRVTKILSDSAFDFEVTISDVLKKLNEFQVLFDRMDNSRSRIARQSFGRKLAAQYKEFLNYLEQVSLFFKLQQAQLIKETELFKRLDSVVLESGERLKSCIENAERVANGSPEKEKNQFWFERLKKRTEDLKISYTLSLQSKAQLKLLRQNDIVLIDKISFILSNTIPLWQTQISIMLGIRLCEGRLDVQQKVLKATEMCIKKAGKKSKHIKAADFEGASRLNEKLKSVLHELELSEKTDSDIRKNIQELIS